jgi:hypothetical protein
MILRAPTPELEEIQTYTEEVTASHFPWFQQGDNGEWEHDRRWPTVPEIAPLSSLIPLSIDITLIGYTAVVMGLGLLFV